LFNKLKGGRLSQLYWYFRNLASYSSVDKIPEEFVMQDYEDYWEKRLNKEGNKVFSYPFILEILEERLVNNTRLLDIGCGNGEMIRLLEKNNDIDCIGIDISQTAVNAAIKKGINARVFDLFNDNLNELGDFDYITMFEVLEHIPNSEEAIMKIRDTFKSKTAFLSVPNTGSLYDRIRLLRGRFPKQWVVHPSEHLRFWTLNDFKFALSYLDIELIKVHPIPHNASLIKLNASLFSQSFLFEVKL